jgi:hypothetical protein
MGFLRRNHNKDDALDDDRDGENERKNVRRMWYGHNVENFPDRREI